MFNRFDAMQVHEVEPGTEIEHDGEKLVVDDEHVVIRGRKLWITPKCNAVLKATIDRVNARQGART